MTAENRKGPGKSDLTELILDSITEGVFTVDPEMNLLSFNRAAEKITGIPAEKALGKKCHEVMQKGAGAPLCLEACPMLRSMETGEPSREMEVEMKTAGKKPIWVRIRTAALRDSKGNLIGGVETFRDMSEVKHLIKRLTGEYTFCDIKGKSPAMKRLFEVLPQVAANHSNVLITGPSGTGKELVARAIHDLSPYHEGPFVAVNCGSIPEALLESELFGHKKGAFTGADRDRKGRFEAAGGGTLFLDEIGELPLSVQVKLLRVLDSGEFTPLGANLPLTASARVVAATNRNLEEEMAKGNFRPDLYYRLNVLNLELPPLNQRKEDIPILVDYFLESLAAERGQAVSHVSSEAMALLLDHPWPGNVRQLQNAIEHALVLAGGGEINPVHLPNSIQKQAQSDSGGVSLADKERKAIEAALTRNHGNRARTAAELGISTTTLWRRLKHYGLV